MAYDENTLEELGSQANILEYWNSAAPHLQARFCHTSLGTKIKIERIGNLELFPYKIGGVGAWQEAMWDFTVQILEPADLVVYISCVEGAPGCGGGGGFGYLGAVCTPNPCTSCMSMNDYQPSSSSFGMVTVNFFLLILIRGCRTLLHSSMTLSEGSWRKILQPIYGCRTLLLGKTTDFSTGSCILKKIL